MADRTTTGKTNRRWLMTFGLYGEFVERHRELPKETAAPGAPTAGTRLAFWARYQRARFVRNSMPQCQRDLLASVPGFSWGPSDERWSARCQQLDRFLRERGRVPRYRAPDEEERRLAAWVHKQRHIAKAGRMPHHRLEVLGQLPFKIV